MKKLSKISEARKKTKCRIREERLDRLKGSVSSKLLTMHFPIYGIQRGAIRWRNRWNTSAKQELTEWDKNRAQAALFHSKVKWLAEGEKPSKYTHKTLSGDELEDSLGKMKWYKSPGFDGLLVNFYMHFWPDLCNMVKNILHKNAYHYKMRHCNYSPKKGNWST